MNIAGIYKTDTESDMAVKTTVAMHEYCVAPTTWHYTTGLFYEHRQGVIKISSASGTSTADTVQKGCLNRL